MNTSSLTPGAALQRPRLLVEHLDLMFRQMAATLGANFFIATVSVFALWDLADREVLVGWGLAIYVLTCARIYLIARYRRAKPAEDRAAPWAWAFTGTAVLSGLLWGSMGVLFFDPHQPLANLYVCIVIAGMLGGSVASLSNFPPAYLGFAIPAVLPFVVRSLLEGGRVYYALAAASLFMLAVNLAYSRAAHRTIRESILLRLRNDDLVALLRREKDVAESANRAKTTFLAAVSHDLRQPAQALGLFVEALQTLAGSAAPLAHAQVRAVSEQMQSALNGLSGLLRGLLDISKLDAGAIAPEPEDIDLGELLPRLEGQFGETAARKGLELHVQRSRFWVRSDRVILERVLGNLLSNAIRYTERGRVVVGCRQRGTDVEIRVEDTGIGIPAEHHDEVFNEFFQLHNPARDRERGLGLGLAIVRRSCDLLGHPVQLASVPGKGSTFSVRLPHVASRAAAGVLAATPPAQRTGGAVLVVDDEAPIRAAMSSLLALWGYRVLACASVAEIEGALREDADEVFAILADYRLAEGVTANEAIAETLRALGRTVPAVIMTGDTSPERIRQANASGHRVLHKPIDAAELSGVLHALQAQAPRLRGSVP